MSKIYKILKKSIFIYACVAYVALFLILASLNNHTLKVNDMKYTNTEESIYYEDEQNFDSVGSHRKTLSFYDDYEMDKVVSEKVSSLYHLKQVDDILQLQLINSSYVCSVNEDTPQGHFLTILINSHVSNTARRNAIRDTWGRVVRDFDSDKHVVILFLVGISRDNDSMDFLSQENKLYRDILQWDFEDTYGNLTLKTLLGLKWTYMYCNNTAFILKTDDDVYLNTSAIIDILTAQNISNSYDDGIPFFVGHRNDKSPVLRVGQWGIPKSIFPNHDYPSYCSGAAYIMSFHVLRKLMYLINSKPNLKILPVEDVFISGIMTSQAGLKCDHYNKFPTWMTLLSIDSVMDLYKNNIFGIHGLSYTKMLLLHKIISSCSNCMTDSAMLEDYLASDSFYNMYYDNIDEGLTFG